MAGLLQSTAHSHVISLPVRLPVTVQLHILLYAVLKGVVIRGVVIRGVVCQNPLSVVATGIH